MSSSNSKCFNVELLSISRFPLRITDFMSSDEFATQFDETFKKRFCMLSHTLDFKSALGIESHERLEATYHAIRTKEYIENTRTMKLCFNTFIQTPNGNQMHTAHGMLFPNTANNTYDLIIAPFQENITRGKDKATTLKKNKTRSGIGDDNNFLALVNQPPAGGDDVDVLNPMSIIENTQKYMKTMIKHIDEQFNKHIDEQFARDQALMNKFNKRPREELVRITELEAQLDQLRTTHAMELAERDKKLEEMDKKLTKLKTTIVSLANEV